MTQQELRLMALALVCWICGLVLVVWG